MPDERALHLAPLLELLFDPRELLHFLHERYGLAFVDALPAAPASALYRGAAEALVAGGHVHDLFLARLRAACPTRHAEITAAEAALLAEGRRPGRARARTRRGAPEARAEGDSTGYSPREVARLLGVSASTVRTWLTGGLLPAERTASGRWSVTPAAVAAFAREHALPLPPELGGPEADPGRAGRSAESTGADERPLRVLVVEDDRALAALVTDHLNVLGMEASFVISGVEALEAAARRVPDVVLLDLMLLPEEMDGFAVLAALRADPRCSTTTFISFSGYARPDARMTGFDASLQKPVTLTTLSDRIVAVHRATAQRRRPPPEAGRSPASLPPVPAEPPAAPGASPLLQLRWDPRCRFPEGPARDRLEHEIGAKALSHRLLLRAPDPYVEITVGTWVAFTDWIPPVLTLRRLVPIPRTDRENDWFGLFRDYTRVYRLPYRREVEPGGDAQRLEQGLARARTLLAALAEDIAEYARRHEVPAGAAALADFVVQSARRAKADAAHLPASGLVARVEEVLCAVHEALDALAPDAAG